MYCSWNATYENLLGTNKPLPQPIPLSVSLLGCGGFGPCYSSRMKQPFPDFAFDFNLQEMVDFLVDAWDQEGLYD